MLKKGYERALANFPGQGVGEDFKTKFRFGLA